VNEGKYLRKSEKNWKNETNPSLLSVEDPHNPDNDVGCIAFKIENAKEAFFQAYTILAESKSHVASPAADESKISLSDFSCSQPDLNVSQLMWVNYSLQCFRARIKSIYKSRDCTDPATCPIHPTNKIHNSLTLSSTRYFNNGTKPHKQKISAQPKDSNKRLSKKANNISNHNFYNNNNNHNSSSNNYNLNYNYNKNGIGIQMDENMQVGKNRSWRGESEPNSKPKMNIYKIVSTDFPGLANNVHVVPYDSSVESPSI